MRPAPLARPAWVPAGTLRAWLVIWESGGVTLGGWLIKPLGLTPLLVLIFKYSSQSRFLVLRKRCYDLRTCPCPRL